MDKFLRPWREYTAGHYVYYTRFRYDNPWKYVRVYTWMTHRNTRVFDGWTYSIYNYAITPQKTFPTAEIAMKHADEHLIKLGYTLLTPDNIKTLELLK